MAKEKTTLEEKIRDIVFDDDPQFKNLNSQKREKLCQDFLYIIACLRFNELDKLEVTNDNVSLLVNYKLQHCKRNESYESVMIKYLAF